MIHHTQGTVWLIGLQCKQKSIWDHPEEVIEVTMKSVITAFSYGSWGDFVLKSETLTQKK